MRNFTCCVGLCVDLAQAYQSPQHLRIVIDADVDAFLFTFFVLHVIFRTDVAANPNSVKYPTNVFISNVYDNKQNIVYTVDFNSNGVLNAIIKVLTPPYKLPRDKLDLLESKLEAMEKLAHRPLLDYQLSHCVPFLQVDPPKRESVHRLRLSL